MSNALVFGRAIIGFNESVLANAAIEPTFTNYIEDTTPSNILGGTINCFYQINTTDFQLGCVLEAKNEIMLSNGKPMKFIRWDFGTLDKLMGSYPHNTIPIPPKSNYIFVAVYGSIYKKSVLANDKAEALMEKIKSWEPK